MNHDSKPGPEGRVASEVPAGHPLAKLAQDVAGRIAELEIHADDDEAVRVIQEWMHRPNAILFVDRRRRRGDDPIPDGLRVEVFKPDEYFPIEL